MLLVDLKKCINNIHMNQSFPGRREDFPTQQAYENWQRREIKQLTELMNTLMLMKPDLALSSANQSDVKCGWIMCDPYFFSNWIYDYHIA